MRGRSKILNRVLANDLVDLGKAIPCLRSWDCLCQSRQQLCNEPKRCISGMDTFVTFVQEMVNVAWNKGFVMVYSHMCFPSNLVDKVVVDYSTISKCSIEYKN